MFVSRKRLEPRHCRLSFLALNTNCRQEAAWTRRSDSSTAGDQVNHRYNQSDHQENMNQTAGHMEAPAQKPQNDEDGKNCPKHRYSSQLKTCVDADQR